MKRYFKILLAVLAAAVLFAALGLAACDGDTTKYKIEVDCGTGGSYTLSEESPAPENASVTLTVTPDEGFAVDKVTVNGKEVSLIGSRYILKMTGDKAVVITFKPTGDTAEKYTVTVICGTGGDYSLSPEAESYDKNSSVTLKVTPDGGFAVKSVEIDGEEVTLQEGEYTFEVVSNVKITIEFAKQFSRDKYVGTWTSVVSSGTLPNELVIGEDSFTFNGTEYPLTATESGFSFTVTEGEDIYRYSFTLEEVGAGKYLLNLTIIMPDSSRIKQTCMKEGVNYSGDFPEELWGNWDAGPSRYPISIGEDGLTIDGNKAVVHSYDVATKTYRLSAGGMEYTLVWDEAAETLTLTVVGNADSATVYTKTPPPEETLFTEFAENYYTNGAHNVQIGADGSFTFDGRLCHIYPVDPTNIEGYGYTFYVGSKLWHLFSISETEAYISDYTDEFKCYTLTGDEAYTVTVTCGDNGSYTLNDPKNGETYGGYEEVIITVIPEAGYRLDKLILDGTDVAWAVTENVYKFYISKNCTVEISFIAEDVEVPVFPDKFYQYTFSSAEVTLAFKDKQIIMTYKGQTYTANEKDAVLTEGKNYDFTVTFEGLGDVHIVYYGQFGNFFSVSCDAFTVTLSIRTAVS